MTSPDNRALDGAGAAACNLISYVTLADVTESHSIYRAVWSSLGSSSYRGEVFERDGLMIATANGKWPIMNTAFLSSPVATKADLQRRISFANDYFGAKRQMWLLILFDKWLDGSIQPEKLLWGHRIAYLQCCVGMQAEKLHEPTGPAPELVFREVNTDAQRLEFADINADSYEFSAEWREDIAAWISQWPKSTVRLYIAYSGTQAVSSAMVHLVGDVVLLGFVATRQGHRRKGYAEAVARHALARAEEGWSFCKSVLHSTPAGLPLYRAMGYCEVTSFGIYLGGCQ